MTNNDYNVQWLQQVLDYIYPDVRIPYVYINNHMHTTWLYLVN
jgi:hypothetical protein